MAKNKVLTGLYFILKDLRISFLTVSCFLRLSSFIGPWPSSSRTCKSEPSLCFIPAFEHLRLLLSLLGTFVFTLHLLSTGVVSPPQGQLVVTLFHLKLDSPVPCNLRVTGPTDWGICPPHSVHTEKPMLGSLSLECPDENPELQTELLKITSKIFAWLRRNGIF